LLSLFVESTNPTAYAYLLSSHTALSLQAIKASVDSVPAFADFLANPTLNRKGKAGDIAAIMKAGKYNKVTASFFNVLAENGRLGATSKIVDTFSELMMATRGETPAKIISAEALSKSQISTLTESLKNFADGKKLIMDTEVDPSILGGLKVQIGDRYIDLSVSSKIQKMTRLLSDSV
jgi:F-type H+-transporting ATPase subunit O